MKNAAVERSEPPYSMIVTSPAWPIFALLLLGLAFFLPNIRWELASDDLSWLRGEAATDLDHYRMIPRFLFLVLHGRFGSSASAALTMIFLFHFVNALLVAYLAWQILNSRLAAWSAAFVLLVNPLTLSTLTWISCFSYVLGATLALASILACWQAGKKERPIAPLIWYAVALLCYGAGLLSSHTLFFLPALFPLIDWLQSESTRKRGFVLAGIAVVIGLSIYAAVYNFDRYGIDTTPLLNHSFLSALVSSQISFGLSLGAAYPLAFFAKPAGFLQICFGASMRWILTTIFIAGGIVFYRPSRMWRVYFVLALSFSALIIPYIMRLYLLSGQGTYHISYVLGGRVFYLPFVVVALAWGAMVHQLHLKSARYTTLLAIIGLFGYTHALFALYDQTDFMGLSVASGTPLTMPSSWTPYAHAAPLWFALAVLGIVAGIGYRLNRSRRTSRN